jgi:NADH:ubiquinone oxidoreductase subunit E
MGDASCCGCRREAMSEDEMLREIEPVIAEYRSRPGGLVPALQVAQGRFGYLPEAVLKRLAAAFDKPYSEVAGVVTFYSFFSTKPRGRHLVRVCLGTACYVRGGQEVLEALRRKLGIDVGETTPDRQFSLEVGRCFGACGMAPVVMVDDTVHQRVKAARIGDLLARYRSADDSAATAAAEAAS